MRDIRHLGFRLLLCIQSMGFGTVFIPTSCDTSAFLEIEVFLCIIIADILYHLIDTLLLITLERYESVLDIFTDEITQSATEILMTWVREERA